MPPNQDNPATPTDPNVSGDQPTPTMPDPLQPAEVPQAPADLQPQTTSPSPEPSMDGAAYGQGSFQPTDVPEAPAVPDTIPDPVAAAQPTPPADTPAASPVQPDAAPVVAPAPTNDPTQPGYVPPVASPAAVPTMQHASSPGSKAKILRLAIVAIVTLFLLAGGGYLLKDTLFTGSQIKVSDLVEDSANGVSFQRPSNWTKTTESSDSVVVFTEGGKPTKESDQAVMISSGDLGARTYETLSEAQREFVYSGFQKKYEDGRSIFREDTCQEVAEPKISRIEQPNFTDAFQIDATCNKFSQRNVKARAKLVIGFKGTKVNVVMVQAVDKTWDKSGDALDEILTTFKPAEE